MIAAVRERSDAIISVDTFEPDVAAACIAAGADVINNTTGLRDPDLAGVIADGGAHVIITHSLAAPRVAHPRPRYADVVTEVADFLQRQAETAVEWGIPEERILLDPGHDLNKNSSALCSNSPVASARSPHSAFRRSPPCRTRTSSARPSDQGKDERLVGSLAAAVICVVNGARIVRMHDIPQAVDAVRMTEAILGWRDPVELKHNI